MLSNSTGDAGSAMVTAGIASRAASRPLRQIHAALAAGEHEPAQEAVAVVEIGLPSVGEVLHASTVGPRP